MLLVLDKVNVLRGKGQEQLFAKAPESSNRGLGRNNLPPREDGFGLLEAFGKGQKRGWLELGLQGWLASSSGWLALQVPISEIPFS